MKNLPKITIVFILIVSAYFVKTARWDGYGGQNWKEQFSSGDAKGYYAYLPQFFLKHDLSHQDPKLLYVNKTDKGYVNKYFIGTSLFWTPFFGVAYEYCNIKGVTNDGYSGPYKKIISIAGLFWLCIALLALAEALKMMAFGEVIISISLLLITLGTNLFYYAVLEPTMSHLYSFTVLAVLLCFGMKYFRSGKTLHFVLSAVAFSLGILLRPTNAVWMICLLPFLAGGITPLKEKLFNWKLLLGGGLVLAFFVFLQCGAYYLETGHWFVRTYAGEGFYFLHPKLWGVLFGFQKGWFIYTPLAALAMFGLVPLYQKNRLAFYSFVTVLLVFIYTIAAWWSWTFADSLGHRAFIDLYPIVAILLAFALTFIPEKLSLRIRFLSLVDSRFILHTVCFLCLAINIIQTYQFFNHILHYNSMDWKRYKYTFLKTSPKYIDCLGGCVDLQPYSTREPKLIYSVNQDFSKPLPGWNDMPAEPFNGAKALHFNGNEFGCAFVFPKDSAITRCEKFYAKVELTRYEPLRNSSSGVLFVNDIANSKQEHEYYSSYPINDEPADFEGDLRTFYYYMEIPGIKEKDASLAFYIWNIKHQNFYLTHMKVELYQIFP
jgi:hypothetical protein